MKNRAKVNRLLSLMVCGVVLLNTCSLPLDEADVIPRSTIPVGPEAPTVTVESLTSVSLLWAADTDADSYKMYRAERDTGPYRPVETTADTHYTDESLESSTEYYYKIACIKGGIEGAKSSSAYVKTAPPSVPEGIVVELSLLPAITLSWDKVPGAASYTVRRATTSNGQYSLINDDAIAALSFSDTGVSANADYFYKISAVNGIGEGEQTEAIQVSTKIPTVPSNVETATLSTTSIQVFWDAVYGVETYKVYMSNSSSGTYNLLENSDTNYFVHHGVNQGAMYFYKVSAANVFGESALSGFILGEIKIPDAPKTVKAEALSESSIKISWDPVPGAIQYVIYRSSSQLTTTTGQSYIHNKLPPYSRYSYQVAAVNEIGTGGKSTAVSVYTQPIPIKEGVWVTITPSSYRYSYYSFPADGGEYYIQWGDGKGNESDARNHISAYWSATNSIENLSSAQRYFYQARSGYNTPQKISVPSSGYVIIEAYSYILSIRYYR
jgi:fibronectin type 3 domain-containing protein